MSIWKWTKRGAAALLVTGTLGFIAFGTELPSYALSLVGSFKRTVRESVPIEVEVQRAKTLLSQLEPELRENIRRIVREEVEIESLEKDLVAHRASVESERGKVRQLREVLRTDHVSYDLRGQTYSRTELITRLERRFEDLRSAENLLATKETTLKKRRAAFEEAKRKLEAARSQRAQIAADIEALESEHRLQEAHKRHTRFDFDDSKIVQTQSLLENLRQRLEVERKVLAAEAQFVEEIPLEVLPAGDDVLERFDAYEAGRETSTPSSGIDV